MSAELLMEGADAYTSLAEVATTDVDTPDAIPTLSNTIQTLTYLLEC